MAQENEPAKLLLPFLQRADELQKHEPLVAYYCRLYAMERGLNIPQSDRTKTTNSLLISLMKQLEKDKKSLTLGPDDNLHIEGFALNVFAKADKQDRAGRADKSTAKTFYAASIFFEILNQFGQLQPDLEQKQKYAAWKAADISKALKDGRKPVPGPPGGDHDLSMTPRAGYDIEPIRNDQNSGPATEFDPSTPNFDKLERQQSSNSLLRPANNPPSVSSNVTPSPPSNITPSPFSDVPPLPYPNNYSAHNFRQPPPSHDYPSHNFPQPPPATDDYTAHNFHQPPPTNRSENPMYQPYQHQPSLQHYPSHETNPYSYPNFQTYPSFVDSSLPVAPSHSPSYYQGSDTSYSSPSASDTTNYPPATTRDTGSRNGTISNTAPAATEAYHYDSNYQPPPEKIAEAHKAARFAVGALAFDDVSIAIDFLKKSLELLTNPSAGQ